MLIEMVKATIVITAVVMIPRLARAIRNAR